MVTRRRSRLKQFARDRVRLKPRQNENSSGADIALLFKPTNVYLGRYYEFGEIVKPNECLRERPGDELATAVLSGFLTALSRDDLLKLAEIA